MTCTSVLTINASGDYAATATLTDENGATVDLTGYAASIVDVTGELTGALAVTVPTPASGLVRIALTWQGAWTTLQRRLGTARLLLVNGADESCNVPFAVDVAGTSLRTVIPRGADQAYGFTWPDDRDGASLTGETVDVVNASATLAGLVTVAVIDAATRACEVRIEGDLSVALGDAGTFQLRRRIAGAQPRTLPPIAVSFA